MIKLKQIKPMIAKSGTNVGKNINVLFFTGKVPGTRVNYQSVLLALGVSKAIAENAVKDNTATFVMDDATLDDFAKNCGLDNGKELIEMGDSFDTPFEELEIRMDFNPLVDPSTGKDGRGVVVKDNVTGKQFRIATSIVTVGKGGLHDNRGWDKAATTVFDQNADAKKEADLTAKKTADAVLPKGQ